MVGVCVLWLVLVLLVGMVNIQQRQMVAVNVLELRLRRVRLPLLVPRPHEHLWYLRRTIWPSEQFQIGLKKCARAGKERALKPALWLWWK